MLEGWRLAAQQTLSFPVPACSSPWLGPQAHAEDTECGQHPVPAFSHHGCQHAALLQTGTLLSVLLLGYGYFWLLVPDLEARLQQLGIFCSVFTISMYVSPLADLAKIIQTKSTQRLSFSLTITTLLSSASWSLYGFRLRDPYIMVPNLPGILTSFIRLGLFCKYSPEHDRKYRLLQT
ncbi:sugar transporter SWEET1 isoform X3 [Psammomys obesus]|uniref:sugar transporter SWEET1 isoform X3 n=1 Tax=Psammomys obesus TaxID=48139 RepID=UPI002453301C|nr:sugar transporter SWEET1 isoform X3 [Psammomys obesus]